MSKDPRIYELNIDGFVITNRSLEELKKIEKYNSGRNCMLYEVKQSKMNRSPMVGCKLDEGEVQRAIHLNRRGSALKDIAVQFNVSYDCLRRSIRRYNERQKSKLLAI